MRGWSLAAATTAGAGIIHLGVTGTHLSESTSHGLFMLVAGLTQLAVAVALARSAGRRVLAIATAVNLTIVGTWVISRTYGLPQFLGGREAPGPVDGAATLLAVAAAALTWSLLARQPDPSASSRVLAVADRLRPAAALAGALAGLVAVTALPSARDAHSHGGRATVALTAAHGGTHVSAGAGPAPASGHGAPEAPDLGPDRAPVNGQAIEVGNHPDAVAEAGGVVWVANRLSNSVSRIDAASGLPIGSPIAVAKEPVAIAIGGGSVWVASFGDNVVSRIDQVTGQVIGSPIPVGSRPTGIAVDQSFVFVANSAEGTVTRIDVRRGQVAGTTERIGFGLTSIAVGEGGVWVTATLDRTVLRLDPMTALPVAEPIRVGKGAYGIATGLGYVWVADATGGTVVRIDPRINEVSGLPIEVDDRTTSGQGPISVVVAAGRVWVANNHDKTVVAIDPITRNLTGSTRFFASSVSRYPGVTSLAASDGALWVTDYEHDRVIRLAIG